MPQEHDLVEHLQESPPNFELFKELDLTSRCCALHTIRVEVTVLTVDHNLDNVRNKLCAQLEESAALFERLARDEAARGDQNRQRQRAAEESRVSAEERKRRRLSGAPGSSGSESG